MKDTLPKTVTINGALITLDRSYYETSPVKAIRSFCLDCQGGERAAVRDCGSGNCPLHPFRMGVNPFHAKAGPKGA